MIKKILVLFLALPFFAYADNGIGSVVAAAVATQVVNTGSAVYMQSHGMQPQYISTPYGTYVVPQQPASSVTTDNKVAPVAPVSEYEMQNQQQNKVQFFNGQVVQAFPGAITGT